MKKILITLLLVVASTNICFAQGLIDNVLDTVQAVNYGVPPSAIVQDYASQYAQQKIDNAQQNTQNQNNYYQPAQYQTNTQYQNPQYQASPVNPYQNVNVDNSSNQNFVINPFGTLQWDDGILDVINKLKAMSGVTEIYFSYDGGRNFSQSVNLKNVPKEKLAGAINSYLLKQTAAETIYKKQKDGTIKVIPTKVRSEDFIDATGKARHYFDSQAHIKAKTVFIENTPFEISISFFANKGMVAYKPSNVVKDSTGYFYPLYMKSVNLNSTSALVNNTWRQIEQVCKNKFSALADTQSEASMVEDPQSNTSEWEVTDKKDNSFSFGFDGDCGLSYSRSRNYSDYLDNLYNQHLIKIESQKYKSVPNSNSQI